MLNIELRVMGRSVCYVPLAFAMWTIKTIRIFFLFDQGSIILRFIFFIATRSIIQSLYASLLQFFYLVDDGCGFIVLSANVNKFWCQTHVVALNIG